MHAARGPCCMPGHQPGPGAFSPAPCVPAPARARQPEIELRIRQPRPAAGLAGARGWHAARKPRPSPGPSLASILPSPGTGPGPAIASIMAQNSQPARAGQCRVGSLVALHCAASRSAMESNARSLPVLMHAHCRCWTSCLSLRALAFFFSCATSSADLCLRLK